ncbi:MAG TPA: hypothetical protein PKB02_02955 [Anaerohalosphaeraceae bacterium]|nr:hypothetical protein [Anaerohalosphaeraceae bacterium]
MTRTMHKIKHWAAGSVGQTIIRYLWLCPAIGLVWVVASYGITISGLSDRVDKAIERYLAMEKQFAEASPPKNESLDAMRTRSLFAGPAATPPLPQCLAILGEYALFGEEWKRTGDEFNGAKILEITPTEVRISWQNQEQVLRPFDVAVEYGGRGQGQGFGRRGETARAEPSAGTRPGEAPAVPEAPRMGPPGMMMGGGPGGFDFRRMSNEELGQMRDRIMNMSPEERRAAFEEFRRNRTQPMQ